MNPIRVITASAGSGKTYKIADILECEIAAGRVRPEGVIATTFTVRAAAELRERVRTRLLSKQLVPQAHRLSAARIGTVHAVCGRLISDFAFELGLPPDLRILVPAAADAALRRAYSSIEGGEEVAALEEIGRRFESFDWQEAMAQVISLARTYRMNSAQFDSFAKTSQQECLSLLEPPAEDGHALDDALLNTLEEFEAKADPAVDTTKDTAAACSLVRQCRNTLQRTDSLRWSDWLRLAGLKTGAKSRQIAQNVSQAAAAHVRHPGLHEDIRKTIELVFRAAGKVRAAYEEHKRALGALDYVDQLSIGLSLLQKPEIVSRLKEEIDLVLVDEFQDTSPVQLEIFLCLASVAKRSVWVGDQKQAIYGFMEANPELMEAVIRKIVGDRVAETLPKSYRSRPDLVRLTSNLFAKAFEGHGIPPERVRLQAESPVEPQGLGPIVERWLLDAKGKADQVAALAACLKAALADPEMKVRDRASQAPRPLQARDIAVLCRQNSTCLDVASALQRLGVRAIIEQLDIANAPEVALVLAGLRLWVDPRDNLAAAEIARLAAFPASGDEWLEAVLKNADGKAFMDLPEAAEIRDARGRRSTAGLLGTVDAVIEAVNVRERCLEWGNSRDRLRNLESLRARAAGYAEECATAGAGCTPIGFIESIVADATQQKRGEVGKSLPEEDGVIVGTWHRAKGLEWPVVVLFELDYNRAPSPMGVHIVRADRAVDLDRPLEGTRIRLWPHPFQERQNKSPFHVAVANHEATRQAQAEHDREELRLLYVGWTRARDRLVLACPQGKLGSGILSNLASGGNPLLGEPDESGNATWGGEKVYLKVREGTVVESLPNEGKGDEGPVASGPKSYPKAFLAASEIEASGEAGRVEQIGDRIAVVGNPDMDRVGDAFHAFLAADRRELATVERTALAAGILKRFEIPAALQPADMVAASDRLSRWANERFPGATWRREWPSRHRLPSGSVIVGVTDLVLQTPSGFAVVDHKTFPGKTEDVLARARSHAGQLGAYADAISVATNTPCLGCLIHLPVTGQVVAVSRQSS